MNARQVYLGLATLDCNKSAQNFDTHLGHFALHKMPCPSYNVRPSQILCVRGSFRAPVTPQLFISDRHALSPDLGITARAISTGVYLYTQQHSTDAQCEVFTSDRVEFRNVASLTGDRLTQSDRQTSFE